MATFARGHAGDERIQQASQPWLQSPLARFRRARLLHVMRALAKHSSEVGRPLRILELSCGAGWTTCAFATQGHRALGIDPSPELIRVGRLFAQESKLDGVFLQGDPLNASWEKAAQETLGGKPDVIYLANALHRFPEASALVERLHERLAPGGQLLISEENPRSPAFKVIRGAGQHHKPFEDWKRLLELKGFSVDERPQGIDPLPGMSRVKPDKCWSIVFKARRS
jgi:SAM-dependent methyltransferase